jgi:hypothetical protein
MLTRFFHNIRAVTHPLRESLAHTAASNARQFLADNPLLFAEGGGTPKEGAKGFPADRPVQGFPGFRPGLPRLGGNPCVLAACAENWATGFRAENPRLFAA